jgi:hypothetical protein
MSDYNPVSESVRQARGVFTKRPRLRTCLRILAVLFTLCGATLCTEAQTRADKPKANQKEKVMTNQVSGIFDVKVIPVTEGETADAAMGRMLLDKQYHGDLEAKAQGQMLTAMSAVPESGAYVAVERVTGTLLGRRGSFMLQHSGTMTRGVPQLSVTVVPDSGTEELTGLTGKLNIRIAEGKHFYDFEYTLPQS